MQYLLTLYDDETKDTQMSEAEMGEMMAAYTAYTTQMQDKGAYIAGEALMPSSQGAMISTRNGTHHIEDGPFADVKEQLGGFYLIEASNLDEALDWAAKCPCASSGSVEVRPLWDIED